MTYLPYVGLIVYMLSTLIFVVTKSEKIKSFWKETEKNLESFSKWNFILFSLILIVFSIAVEINTITITLFFTVLFLGPIVCYFFINSKFNSYISLTYLYIILCFSSLLLVKNDVSRKYFGESISENYREESTTYYYYGDELKEGNYEVPNIETGDEILNIFFENVFGYFYKYNLFFLPILSIIFFIYLTSKKLIFVGLGTSGLNVTTEWIKNGGEGFCIMNKIDESSSLTQYTDFDKTIKLFLPHKRYVIVSGLGGKTAISYIEKLIYRLETILEVDFYILAFLPFKFEGSIRNNQAKNLQKKLKTLKNYREINLQNFFIENKSNDLNKTFKKMDKKGIELIKSI